MGDNIPGVLDPGLIVLGFPFLGCAYIDMYLPEHTLTWLNCWVI